VLSESFDAKARDVEQAPLGRLLRWSWGLLERIGARLHALAARYDAWRIREG
jgi:hypothetical protein